MITLVQADSSRSEMFITAAQVRGTESEPFSPTITLIGVCSGCGGAERTGDESGTSQQ